jgi:2-dehydropantoate 2-reductase
MKICMIGAGAIGGLLAVKFALAGKEVTAVDQGLHLQAMRENGLRLHMADGTQWVAPNLRVTGQIKEVGISDLIILAVKAHQLATVAPHLPRLYGPDTVVLTVQNGLPWWYFQRHGGALEGTRLQTLDPDGVMTQHIPAERILGCVAYPASAMMGPGRIQHIEGNRFPVGELDGSRSERAMRVADLFNTAGFKSFVLEDIRAEIWLKAWGALSFNPISALTQATMVDICRFPETRALVATMMREAQVIAEKLGITFRHPIEKRIAGAEAVGAHKTSMLQDLQAGRSLEIEAVIGAIAELGRLTETPCLSVDAVYACAKLLDHTLERKEESPI